MKLTYSGGLGFGVASAAARKAASWEASWLGWMAALARAELTADMAGLVASGLV